MKIEEIITENSVIGRKVMLVSNAAELIGHWVEDLIGKIGEIAEIRAGDHPHGPKMYTVNYSEDESIYVSGNFLRVATGAVYESVTDYNPKDQGGTRADLLEKYKKSGKSEDGIAARKAGATQDELKAARREFKEFNESASAGGTSSGSMATTASGKIKNPKKVGTLFGGSYGEDAPATSKKIITRK